MKLARVNVFHYTKLGELNKPDFQVKIHRTLETQFSGQSLQYCLYLIIICPSFSSESSCVIIFIVFLVNIIIQSAAVFYDGPVMISNRMYTRPAQEISSGDVRFNEIVIK